MNRPIWRPAVRVAALYILIAGAWILFSDTALAAFTSNPSLITQFGIYKGWGFVCVTGILLFLERYWSEQRQARLSAAEQAVRQQAEAAQERLAASLEQVRRQEAALRESEELFRLVVENAPDAIFVQAQGKFAYVNAATLALFGAESADQLLDQPVAEHFHPDDRAQVQTRIRQLNEERLAAPRLDERCLRFDGLPADAEISAVPFNYHGVPGALVFARDVTERKRAEQLIRAQSEQLEAQNQQLLAQNEELTVQGNSLAEAEAQLRAGNTELERRVAARTAELSARTRELSLANAALVRAARMKDEFLASMSHELRTPLTGILGLSEVLRMGIQGPLTDKQLTSLELIEESGQHLLALINDILDVAKVEAGKMELELRPVMVAEVCQASVQFVKELATKKQLKVTVDRDMGVTTLRADARRLKQMLVNLLSNAVKFTPEGGEVGLEVRGEPAQQRVRFTVRDTGIGIAPADLEKLFKPFVQLDSRLAREYSGTGLGLSLVMGLAELHGGSVAVESAPGQGSRFSILMPWTPAEETPVANRYQPPVVIPAAVSKILTVEDSPIAAEQTTQYLSDLGIKNDVIGHGGGAVERALEVQPDVILLDLLLPDISGWEVLQQLKANPRTRDIPVIIVSIVDERARAQEAGAAGYLIKPVAFSDLQEALSRGMRLAAQRTVAVSRSPLPEAEPASTVLLAEDSEYVIASLVDVLESLDCRVAVARNGHEALKQARVLQPDVILMDIQMPGLDGLEVTRRLRAEPNGRLASVPIIALTALAMPGDRERGLAAGATEYLTKPVQIDQLLQLIQKLLGRTTRR